MGIYHIYYDRWYYALSEIQNKEIINIANGKNLRHILDLKIDPETGKIISIVLSESRGFFPFLFFPR